MKREVERLNTALPKSGTWADKEQTAAHFYVSVRTVTNWMRRRIIPFTKVGRVVRFDLDRCNRALQAHSVQSLGERFTNTN